MIARVVGDEVACVCVGLDAGAALCCVEALGGDEEGHWRRIGGLVGGDDGVGTLSAREAGAVGLGRVVYCDGNRAARLGAVSGNTVQFDAKRHSASIMMRMSSPPAV